MKIGIIGGGGVGQTLGSGLIALGHQVTLGIRSPSDEELAKPRAQGKPLAEWIAATGGAVATMAEAASGADLVINATHGEASIAALTLAGADNLAGKVLIDVANPLDFSKGFPPALSAEYSGHTSLGEQIQAAFPAAHVVKAFNTIGAAIMTNPGLVKGEHDLFICGNDAGAKATVAALAQSLGWSLVPDLGDIKGARAQETLVLVWLQLIGTTGGTLHNLHVARG
jgi:predicted dinucleotide-binding enzyme